MRDTLTTEAICEELLARAQRTAEMEPSQSRADRVILEHRQLRSALSDLSSEYRGYQTVHKALVRLVRRALVALSPITNGRRFWTPKLPREARTELTLLNTFMRANKK